MCHAVLSSLELCALSCYAAYMIFSAVLTKPLSSFQYPLLLQPLPADKIKLVRYALSPTEIVSNFGLKLRRGESGGTIEGEKRAHLSFVGNGANPTNIEAMRWFASDIFELIRKELPGVQLILIGMEDCVMCHVMHVMSCHVMWNMSSKHGLITSHHSCRSGLGVHAD